MAIPVNLRELLLGNIVESDRIEYMADLEEASFLHAVCAFANDIDNIGGGYIVIGIEEKDGVPVFPAKGISTEAADRMMKRIPELYHLLEPFYAPAAEVVLYQGKYLILIRCPGGPGRPYRAPKAVVSEPSGRYYYIRRSSCTVIASPQEEKELFYISSSIPFDDRPNLAASVRDIDENLIREHLKKTGSRLYPLSADRSVTELAGDMELLDGPPENLKPRNIALLMFSAHPEKYFRNARIEVVDMPDLTGTRMTRRVFTGPIQNQLTDALQFIQNYILAERVIKDDTRAEAERIWNYPYRAVEEILSSAVCHRSYQINEPITVRSTPEGLEITSFPGFDRSITDGDIQSGRIRGRLCRNRRIGDFLKELHLIEGRNTGFPNAYAALKENGSPALVFDMDPDRQYLSVTIPIHSVFLKKTSRRNAAYENKVLEAAANRPMSLTELSLAMGYKGITAKLRDTVKRLTETGRLSVTWTEQGQRRYQTRKRQDGIGS